MNEITYPHNHPDMFFMKITTNEFAYRNVQAGDVLYCVPGIEPKPNALVLVNAKQVKVHEPGEEFLAVVVAYARSED